MGRLERPGRTDAALDVHRPRRRAPSLRSIMASTADWRQRRGRSRVLQQLVGAGGRGGRSAGAPGNPCRRGLPGLRRPWPGRSRPSPGSARASGVITVPAKSRWLVANARRHQSARAAWRVPRHRALGSGAGEPHRRGTPQGPPWSQPKVPATARARPRTDRSTATSSPSTGHRDRSRDRAPRRCPLPPERDYN